jgi:hypothetical protein
MDQRHGATVSHDVLVQELMTRTVSNPLPGAYNLLFREDGQLKEVSSAAFRAARYVLALRRDGLGQLAHAFRREEPS